MISEHTKQRIRERVPLQDLVREYNVHLIPSGRRMKGLCPFHSEKTPSFHVDVEKQSYYCFGCHAGGDLFSFVRSLHHLDYPEAVELLARRAGVTIEYEGGGRPPRDRERTVALYDVLSLAQDFYHRYLLDDPQARVARDYLKRRGIEPAMWERFRIGFAPPEWDAFARLASRKGIDSQLLERAGLVRSRNQGESSASGHYDYFRGRVMFPIQDPQGRAIGFGARTLGDDQPKYLNTPKTPLFEKSQVLYALPQARTAIHKENRIAIVEGYTDAIMAHQAGLEYFVASLGTAFTQENARRLSRLAPRALLVFDGDDAGQKASERSLDLLVPENIDVRVYSVKDGKDPCDAILALGGQEFRRRMELESVGLFEFKWRRTMEAKGLQESGVILRTKALDEFLTLLSRVPNVVAQKLYLREFSERIGVSEDDISKRMKDLLRKAAPARMGAGLLQRGAPTPSPGEGAAAKLGGAPLSGVASPASPPTREPLDVPLKNDPLGPGLTELLLECLLALPGRARDIWERLPRTLLDEHPFSELADPIARQLEGGPISIPRLIEEVDDPEAQRALSRIVSRLEDDEGHPTQDYEEVWLRAERDLGRFVLKSRADEVKTRMAEGNAAGDNSAKDSLRREYFEILKELKK